MFIGILGEEKPEETEKKALFTDFNLDVCISKINSLTRGYDLLAYYNFIPKKKETTEYRRMITGDFQNASLRESFVRYASAVEKAKKQEKNSSYSHHKPEKLKWHMDALYGYADAVENLYRDLKQAEELSAAMKQLLQYIEEYLNTETYREWKSVIEKIHKELDEKPVSFVVQKNKIIFEENPDLETFEKKMVRAFRLQGEQRKERISYDESHSLTAFEKVMSERLIKSTDQSKPLSSLAKVNMDDKLVQLASDVQFYLGFFEFCKFMKGKGYGFSLPQSGEKMSIESGYDAAMAVKSDEPVIPNDFEIRDGEKFFVITGANGGGKTTFARMIGQILYFSQMGLMVPCEHAVLPFFPNLLSHFSDEESEKTGRGKLVEELARLQPMMKVDKDNGNTFVILNELFTTAATLDAGIMGKRVLEHFVKQDCCGIYVTHIQALAEDGNGIVSMVAELQQDHHTRTFKINRKPAAAGEYEDSIITKYNMTYEQMKEVMRDGD